MYVCHSSVVVSDNVEDKWLQRFHKILELVDALLYCISTYLGLVKSMDTL